MRPLIKFTLLILLVSCSIKEEEDSFIFTGLAGEEVEYMLFDKDTIPFINGHLEETIQIKDGRYEYIQLNTWKWPKLIYVEANRNLNIDFTTQPFNVNGDKLNTYLLNVDSILTHYSLRWDMQEEEFRNLMRSELAQNISKIDSVFQEGSLVEVQLVELKQIELLKIAHRTANFISFQERNGNNINRNIYDFVHKLDLNNIRLEKQVNNRNFQYYYLTDKVSEELPDAIYPFAVIDTINKYSTIESIRKMIISSVVESAFFSDDVDYDMLINTYEEKFGTLEKDNKLLLLYDQIQKLKPGNPAPDFGQLKDLNGELVSIEDLKGRNFLISAWGTWCPYCKEELPHLKKLIKQYSGKFVNVGISLDKDKSLWKAYIKENDWNGIHLIDSERKSAFKSNYLIGGTNFHLLVDKDGLIVSHRQYKPSSEELEELIRNLSFPND